MPPPPWCARRWAAAAVATALLLPLARAPAPCARDGLHADFAAGCADFYRCASGVATRFRCPAGHAFSEAEAACIPRARVACVPRTCARNDSRAYAEPGTACHHYYRCVDGAAEARACAPGAWFDAERQACARAPGICYEPLCAGLADGDYADPSHGCTRRMRCTAGALAALLSCDERCRGACADPRFSSVPIPVGDAPRCAGDDCAAPCTGMPDGAYADATTACREYYLCIGEQEVKRGACDAGTLFSRGACRPAAQARCEATGGPCRRRPDGLHRDWRDCASWLVCRRGRVAQRGRCGAGLAFDGTRCVPRAIFHCEGPSPAAECAALPSGDYADPASNCSRYFHCEGGLRTQLRCAAGELFDGVTCTAERWARGLCPALAPDACAGRADGVHRARDGGCRAWVACAAGREAVYACAPGSAFDGQRCAPPAAGGAGECALRDATCAGRADGYYGEAASGCRRFVLCAGGARVGASVCPAGRAFDGDRCAPPKEVVCHSSD